MEVCVYACVCAHECMVEPTRSCSVWVWMSFIVSWVKGSRQMNILFVNLCVSFLNRCLLCMFTRQKRMNLKVLVSILACSSAVKENLLNLSQWGPVALPLIISCFLHVCLLWSPCPGESNLFSSPPLPSALPKTVCIGALNQVLAVNLKRHGYENISRERWTLAKEMSTMRPRALAVLGALTFYLTTSSPLSLCFVRMSVTDCRSGLSDLQWSCVIYSLFWPQKSWV